MDSLNDYNYELPPELIASEPLEQRDQSRLLVVERSSGTVRDATIRDLPELLNPGDCLVLNNTRVLPARLFGIRTSTGGKWEGLFLESHDDGTWRLICETRGKLQPGESVTIRAVDEAETDGTFMIDLVERDDEGIWTARPQTDALAEDVLTAFGTMPLPPYIGRRIARADDRERYQTTYAAVPGAVAAPTAGLHFTPELIDECRSRGVGIQFVTLHVGIGTFRPITADRLSDHTMHEEWCSVPAETAEAIRQTRQSGGRVVAIGTTTVRTLEAAADHPGRAWNGRTRLFIRPPYEMRSVDCLLTNFHLPKSTLLVLVSAMAGRELIRSAYEHAIEQRYRFFSYGDAMLIV